MKKLFSILAFLSMATMLFAVGLAWDPSPDSSVTGYAIYYGKSSGVWTTRVDVGNVTNTTITLVADGSTYFFVATAYDANGLESEPSNEVNYTPPNQQPTNSTPSKVEEFRIMAVK